MKQLRKWIALILIGSMAIVLAACGDAQNEGQDSGINAGGQADNKSAEQAKDQAENNNGSEAAMRKFETVMGEIEIPAEPKRIVATQYLGHLLSLGVKPIGAGTASLNQYFLKDQTEGIEDIGDDSVALEKIASLEPDLIIRPSDKNYEQFAKIAPTIVIPWGARELYAELREFGDFLGKSEEAEKAIQRYEAKVAEAKEKLQGVVKEGETVGVYEIWAKSFWVVGESFGRGTRNLFAGLGYQPPDAIKENVLNGGAGLDISLESLPQMAADYMFVTVYGADGGDNRAKEIMDSPLWQTLPAYKNNRIFILDIDQFSAGDLISLEKQLEIQTDLLLGSKQE